MGCLQTLIIFCLLLNSRMVGTKRYNLRLINKEEITRDKRNEGSGVDFRKTSDSKYPLPFIMYSVAQGRSLSNKSLNVKIIPWREVKTRIKTALVKYLNTKINPVDYRTEKTTPFPDTFDSLEEMSASDTNSNADILSTDLREEERVHLTRTDAKTSISLDGSESSGFGDLERKENVTSEDILRSILRSNETLLKSIKKKFSLSEQKLFDNWIHSEYNLQLKLPKPLQAKLNSPVQRKAARKSKIGSSQKDILTDLVWDVFDNSIEPKIKPKISTKLEKEKESTFSRILFNEFKDAKTLKKVSVNKPTKTQISNVRSKKDDTQSIDKKKTAYKRFQPNSKPSEMSENERKVLARKFLEKLSKTMQSYENISIPQQLLDYFGKIKDVRAKMVEEMKKDFNYKDLFGRFAMYMLNKEKENGLECNSDCMEKEMKDLFKKISETHDNDETRDMKKMLLLNRNTILQELKQKPLLVDTLHEKLKQIAQKNKKSMNVKQVQNETTDKKSILFHRLNEKLNQFAKIYKAANSPKPLPPQLTQSDVIGRKGILVQRLNEKLKQLAYLNRPKGYRGVSNTNKFQGNGDILQMIYPGQVTKKEFLLEKLNEKLKQLAQQATTAPPEQVKVQQSLPRYAMTDRQGEVYSKLNDKMRQLAFMNLGSQAPIGQLQTQSDFPQNRKGDLFRKLNEKLKLFAQARWPGSITGKELVNKMFQDLKQFQSDDTQQYYGAPQPVNYEGSLIEKLNERLREISEKKQVVEKSNDRNVPQFGQNYQYPQMVQYQFGPNGLVVDSDQFYEVPHSERPRIISKTFKNDQLDKKRFQTFNQFGLVGLPEKFDGEGVLMKTLNKKLKQISQTPVTANDRSGQTVVPFLSRSIFGRPIGKLSLSEKFRQISLQSRPTANPIFLKDALSTKHTTQSNYPVLTRARLEKLKQSFANNEVIPKNNVDKPTFRVQLMSNTKTNKGNPIRENTEYQKILDERGEGLMQTFTEKLKKISRTNQTVNNMFPNPVYSGEFAEIDENGILMQTLSKKLKEVAQGDVFVDKTTEKDLLVSKVQTNGERTFEESEGLLKTFNKIMKSSTVLNQFTRPAENMGHYEFQQHKNQPWTTVQPHITTLRESQHDYKTNLWTKRNEEGKGALIKKLSEKIKKEEVTQDKLNNRSVEGLERKFPSQTLNDVSQDVKNELIQKLSRRLKQISQSDESPIALKRVPQKSKLFQSAKPVETTELYMATTTDQENGNILQRFNERLAKISHSSRLSIQPTIHSLLKPFQGYFDTLPNKKLLQFTPCNHTKMGTPEYVLEENKKNNESLSLDERINKNGALIRKLSEKIKQIAQITPSSTPPSTMPSEHTLDNQKLDETENLIQKLSEKLEQFNNLTIRSVKNEVDDNEIHENLVSEEGEKELVTKLSETFINLTRSKIFIHSEEDNGNETIEQVSPNIAVKETGPNLQNLLMTLINTSKINDETFTKFVKLLQETKNAANETYISSSGTIITTTITPTTIYPTTTPLPTTIPTTTAIETTTAEKVTSEPAFQLLIPETSKELPDTSKELLDLEDREVNTEIPVELQKSLLVFQNESGKIWGSHFNPEKQFSLAQSWKSSWEKTIKDGGANSSVNIWQSSMDYDDLPIDKETQASIIPSIVTISPTGSPSNNDRKDVLLKDLMESVVKPLLRGTESSDIRNNLNDIRNKYKDHNEEFIKTLKNLIPRLSLHEIKKPEPEPVDTTFDDVLNLYPDHNWSLIAFKLKGRNLTKLTSSEEAFIMNHETSPKPTTTFRINNLLEDYYYAQETIKNNCFSPDEPMSPNCKTSNFLSHNVYTVALKTIASIANKTDFQNEVRMNLEKKTRFTHVVGKDDNDSIDLANQYASVFMQGFYGDVFWFKCKKKNKSLHLSHLLNSKSAKNFTDIVTKYFKHYANIPSLFIFQNVVPDEASVAKLESLMGKTEKIRLLFVSTNDDVLYYLNKDKESPDLVDLEITRNFEIPADGPFFDDGMTLRFSKENDFGGGQYEEYLRKKLMSDWENDRV